MVFKQKTDAEGLNELRFILESVLDIMPSRVFWKDRNYIYGGCNKLFASDAGFENESEIIGKNDYDLVWKKSETEFYRAIDERVMSSGKPELGIVEPQKRSDGKEVWLETNKAPIIGKNGEVIGIIGTYHDVTDRVQSEIKLKDYTKQLEVKNKELEQFAYIASHDLQGPLNTIFSLLNMLYSNSSHLFGEEEKKIIEHVNKATQRMKALISGVLEYSTIGNNASFSQIDMNQMVSEALDNLKASIEEANCEIHVDSLPVFNGLENVFPMLFQNLINNAIKFRKADVDPVIKISCSEKDGYYIFEISDNGIGMAQDKLKEVFQMFQKLSSENEYQGHGIGLSHCKKIVELHQGEIWVTSELGEGSTFKFKIPIGA